MSVAFFIHTLYIVGSVSEPSFKVSPSVSFFVGFDSSVLYEDKNIVFSIVGGDITTDKSTSVKNIDSKVVSYIKKAMERDKFNKSDITRIVHLIDTDGAYIPDEKIIYNDIDKPYYSEKNIETRNIEYMKTRNQQNRFINKYTG